VRPEPGSPLPSGASSAPASLPLSGPLASPSRPSLRPAFLLLGIAALILVFGVVIALAGGKSAPSSGVTGVGRTVPGTRLRAVAASSVLRHIETGGEPPSNIVADLTVPAGSRYMTAGGSSSALDQYDRSVTFSVSAPGNEVVRFYEAELSRARWVLESERATGSGAHQLLAERAGSDGYGWYVGIDVRDQSPTVAPALAGSGQSAASCTVVIRLEQQGEGD
jgi:hypothetical protein